MSLVNKIKKMCDEKGMTFASLERELKFGNGTIRKWDNATPSGDKLAKVADFFNVSVDYLLDRDVNTNSCNLDNVYLSFAKYAQDNGIDTKDIELAIKTIQEIRKKNQK